MKLRFLFFPVMVVAFLVSCDSQPTEGTRVVSSDTVPGQSNKFCDAWNNYSNAIQDSIFLVRFDVPLDTLIVQECIREYREKLGVKPPNVTDVLFTYSVAFDTKKLEHWLNGGVFANSNELRMEFGIYTQAAIELSRRTYPSDQTRHIHDTNLHKTTVFMSPYKNGYRVSNLEPFNLGSLHP